MRRRELAGVLRSALAEMDLRGRVRDALERRELLGGRGPVRLLAIGKAAPRMTEGALDALGADVSSAVVVTTDGTVTRGAARAALRSGAPMLVLHASHPLPDERSVRAAEAALALAGAHGRGEGRLLVLVSGGSSSLVCAPGPGISVATKRAVARAMLRSGADVREINVVRKHLSRVKGGGLVVAAHPDPVVTLVASDVIGGEAADVGSGPSVPDPSSAREARRLLARHAPRYAELPLTRTLPPGDVRAATARAVVVASPEELARVVARHLRERGVSARVLPPSEASPDALAAEILALAGRAARGTAFVRAAEPSVTLPRRGIGRGGRASHVAALVGRALPRGAVFAALATDGVDGASGTSGAIVDGAFAARVSRRLGPSALVSAITRFDTGPLHLAVGTAVRERPTGHNLADLHVLVVS